MRRRHEVTLRWDQGCRIWGREVDTPGSESSVAISNVEPKGSVTRVSYFQLQRLNEMRPGVEVNVSLNYLVSCFL
jgi:hypothetical protein